MTQPIAGWYADPAGDTTKLRYWDGSKWTDDLMDAPMPQATATPEVEATAAMVESAAVEATPDVHPTAAQVEQQTQPAQPTQTATAYETAYQQTAGPATAAYQQPFGQPVSYEGSPVINAPIYVNYADVPLYDVNSQDSTLRLIAFVFALISTITAGFVIIPLAWMIPMTVMTWQIYKGKRANTVGFGVCSLIFLSLVSGILLLVSTKDE